MWRVNNPNRKSREQLVARLAILMFLASSLVLLISCTQKPPGFEMASEPSIEAWTEENQFSPDALEAEEVCVINNTEAEAKKFDLFGQSRGYTKKKRRSLEDLKVVMTIFTVPSGRTVRQGVAEFRQEFPSDIIDANHRYSLQSKDSAPDPRRYGFQLVGWDQQTLNCANEGQHIGMIDTTIDRSHPSLKGQDIRTQSFLSEKIPTTSSEHGTAVATLLIGTSGPSQTGLLPKAKLSVAETFRELQPGHVEATTWNIVRGLDWLVKQKVQVINLSLGGPPNGLLTYAINRTLTHNIPIVAAAGNTGPHGRPMYPAAQEGVIAATALDAGLHSYNFASRGDFIMFSAPGVDIWVPRGEEQGVFRSGTSFAAPFVTTAVAVVKSAHPQWASDQVAEYLATHAKDLGAEGKDRIFGWGLIQIPNICRPLSSP